MIAVSVLGAERVARGLGALAARVRDLSSAWRTIGARMVRTAVSVTPVLTGRLVSTIKARASREDVILSAGAGIEYAGVQNYGWAARNIAAHHFIERAGEVEEQRAAGDVEELLTRTARLAGLV